MNNIHIRKVLLQDIDSLQHIGRQTFYETFANENTPEDIQRYLDESFSNEKLTEELSNSNSEFYFASDNKNVIGYLKLNLGEAQTELKDRNAIEIERIYVLKEYHGQQVGQLLFDAALQIAKQKKANYLWLGVWEKNTRAIHFYHKNGFVEFDKHLFKLGKDEQTDIMMKLMLN
jgi:ribosomal protein S18 acetylase RimI-like enzyme